MWVCSSGYLDQTGDMCAPSSRCLEQRTRNLGSDSGGEVVVTGGMCQEQLFTYRANRPSAYHNLRHQYEACRLIRAVFKLLLWT